MSTLGKVPPPVSRSESVVVELRNMILRGAFEAGFHLQEVMLANMLGVSRTPIREALTTLAHEGLLEPGPKRGFKVRTFVVGEIIDAYEVRANLEGLAARLVAEAGLEAEVRVRLDQCLADGDRMLLKGLSQEDHREWLEMNNLFHTTLVGAARNAMLMSFVEQSHRVPLAGARHVHWYRLDPKNFALARRAHEAHHEIFDAVAAGKSVRAEALMREHVYFSQRLIADYVQQGQVGFDTELRLATAL